MYSYVKYCWITILVISAHFWLKKEQLLYVVLTLETYSTFNRRSTILEKQHTNKQRGSNLVCSFLKQKLCYVSLSVWCYTYPSEKYEFVIWDYDIPNIWKNTKCSKPPTSYVPLWVTMYCHVSLCTTNYESRCMSVYVHVYLIIYVNAYMCVWLYVPMFVCL